MAVSQKKLKATLERYNQLIKRNSHDDAIREIALEEGRKVSTIERRLRKAKEEAPNVDNRPKHLPKVLVFDIETSPILARVWGLWQQNVGLNQIKEDWFVMSYAAKWLGVDGVMYKDLRGVIDDTDKVVLRAFDAARAPVIRYVRFDIPLVEIQRLDNELDYMQEPDIQVITRILGLSTTHWTLARHGYPDVFVVGTQD